MANGYIVPGFYAVIEDYQLSSLETAQSLKEDAIIFFGDLPDFVYVPDEKSTDVNAVKRVRITPNTVLPVTDVNELINTLTGKNILDGILTQEQKDELLCRDMINVIQMSESLALEGKLAVVKIVKKDGTRPDINNKFEVYQALENAYQKLGNVKASQIVPIGIAGDDDFISGDEKEPTMTISQSKENGSVIQDKIYNDVYSFTPVEKVSNLKVELAFSNPEVLKHTGDTAEQQLIKKEGLASDKVKYLLKGKVVVKGQTVVKDVELKFEEGKFVSVSEILAPVIKGQASLVIGAGTVFATVLTEEVGGKTVAKLDGTGAPLLNHYDTFKVQAEVSTFDALKLTCKANEEVEFVGKLKQSATDFTAKLEGEHFELTEAVTLQEDKITFRAKGRFTQEGPTEKVKLTVEDPFVPFTKELTINVTGTMSTCKANEEVEFVGKLKQSATDFTAKLEGEHFELTEAVTLQEDKLTFKAKGRFTQEGPTEKVKLIVEDPFVPFTKELTINVTGTMSRSGKSPVVTPKAVVTVPVVGANQYVAINIDKPTSNWIEVKDAHNLKAVVDKIAILEGKKEGVEQYTVTESGTVVLTFKEVDGKYKAVLTDTAEVIEPVEYEIDTKKSEGKVVVSGSTYLAYEGITFVLYDGLVVENEPVTEEERSSVYFDAKADSVEAPEYVINYVPADSEPIMASLKYVSDQVKTFSEVLMVWGTRPAQSTEPNVVEKHVRKLINLPKFKRGFKVRVSASKETDFGMFLSVVAGTIKVNGIGGISNFTSHRVVDYEREQGGIGEIKPLTNKVFVETTKDFYTGSNVEIKTYVGVKQKSLEAIVLSAKEVMGKTMLTLNKEVDTSIFSLNGFEVMIANTDTKDRHGSYAAAQFAITANKERDRAPIQIDIDGVADFSYSQEALRLLIENKFTVITKNLITGKGTIVDTPLMTRKDSDYQSRSAIGTVLALLNALRKVANEKKGKRFPKKEDKVKKRRQSNARRRFEKCIC